MQVEFVHKAAFQQREGQSAAAPRRGCRGRLSPRTIAQACCPCPGCPWPAAGRKARVPPDPAAHAPAARPPPAGVEMKMVCSGRSRSKWQSLPTPADGRSPRRPRAGAPKPPCSVRAVRRGLSARQRAAADHDGPRRPGRRLPAGHARPHAKPRS